jgi:hypothetical protein
VGEFVEGDVDVPEVVQYQHTVAAPHREARRTYNTIITN